jgi:hypothetical protein
MPLALAAGAVAPWIDPDALGRARRASVVATSLARLDTWRMSRTGDDPHRAADHEDGSELSETQLRVRALERILVEKGYVDPAALDVLIEAHETQIGPHNGARVVAKAWWIPASGSGC